MSLSKDNVSVNPAGVEMLIVDDSKYIQHCLSEILLEIEGIKSIEFAESPQGAQKSVEAHDFDVMVIDIHLSQGTGFDVLKMLKDRGVDCLLIVLTNYPATAYRDKALELGADFFFDKFHEFDKVVEVVRHYIQTHSLYGNNN